MEYDKQIENLQKVMLNVMADVTIGKNLEMHLSDTIQAMRILEGYATEAEQKNKHEDSVKFYRLINELSVTAQDIVNQMVERVKYNLRKQL